MGICESSPNKSNDLCQQNQPIKIKPINKHHQTNNGNTGKERETIKYFSQNNNTEKPNGLILTNDVIVSDSCFNPEQIYQKVKLIGEGAFGEVWKVRHKVLGKEFAMKIIEKNPACNIEVIKNEIEILKKNGSS